MSKLGYRAEIFICPTVNLADQNGLGGHSHLYECPNCPLKFVPAELLADCPDHATDLIEESAP